MQGHQMTESRKLKAGCKMREMYIEKLIVNCNVGESGDKLTKASRVVEQLTGQQPIYGRGRLLHHLYPPTPNAIGGIIIFHGSDHNLISQKLYDGHPCTH